LQWENFDIVCATSAMNRFNMLPREGRLKAAKTYLKTFPKWKIFDTTYPNYFIYPIENHSNWMEFYYDAEEEISNDLSKTKEQGMTVHVDTDHAHGLVTRSSINGILLILNDTPLSVK
jgi:hypothetical protein